MKIIFLDIDGVLNHHRVPDKIKKPWGEVSKKCVDLLNKLTDETGAKIVISSTWRKDNAKKYGSVSKRLAEMGVTGDIVDSTPEFNLRSVYRGNEIDLWLDQNLHNYSSSPKYKFKSYVIIDDDSDMLYWQKDNYVQTNYETKGFNQDAYDKALEILERQHA